MASVRKKKLFEKKDFHWGKIVFPLIIGIVGGVFVGYTTKLKQFEVNIFIAIMLSVCVLVVLLDIRRQIIYCKSKLEK